MKAAAPGQKHDNFTRNNLTLNDRVSLSQAQAWLEVSGFTRQNKRFAWYGTLAQERN
jgi:hypothetical protein